MKSVKLKFLIFLLTLGISYQGYTSCGNAVDTRTWDEDAVSKVGKGIKSIFTLDFNNMRFDEKLLQFVKVRGVPDSTFFNPQVEVCTYDKERCRKLSINDSCKHIYGTQWTGGGVSAKAFIRWEGVKEGEKIIDGLEWEWAEGVTPDEQDKFANSPKICVCSQKDACVYSVFSYGVILDPAAQACDTCVWGGKQQKVQCVPLPRTPSPPPFCENLLCVAQQRVDIIPVKDVDNDYFSPKVRVRIGEKMEKLDVQKANQLLLKMEGGSRHYFKTDKRDGKICATYCGTEKCGIQSKFPERCFPAPRAPQPRIVEVVDNNTLRIKVKMSSTMCSRAVNGRYEKGDCTFNINTTPKQIGDLLLRVVKPEMKREDKREESHDVLLKQLLSEKRQFKLLQKNGCIPSVQKASQDNKDMSIKYVEASQSKMLCISGWKPYPEESVFRISIDSVIPLRLEGTKYIKCPAVYSLESNKMFYGKCEDINNLPQEKLDKVDFDIVGNIYFSDERRTADCSANSDKKAKDRLTDERCMVYKLQDSNQYIRQGTQEVFDISRYSSGKETDNGPFTVDKAEVFYADKLCTFDLTSLKHNLKQNIGKSIKDKIDDAKRMAAESIPQDELGNLSKYESISIEAWGDGEDGQLAKSRIERHSDSGLKEEISYAESRLGRPGDYIKARLRINKEYPFINVSNEGSIVVKICRDQENKVCKPLIKVVGGNRFGNDRTMVYESGLEIERIIIEGDKVNSSENNKIAYIRDSTVKYKSISNCSNNTRSSEDGAGGCIDKDNLTSGSGSKGKIIIKPIYSLTTEDEAEGVINAIINSMIEGNENLSRYSLREDIDMGTIKKIIQEGIEKELSCGERDQPGRKQRLKWTIDEPSEISTTRLRRQQNEGVMQKPRTQKLSMPQAQ